MKVAYYRGDKVYFRPIELEDEPMVRQWINDPDNWTYLDHHPPLNACREREWIEQQGKSPTDYAFGVVTEAEDRLIGTMGLHGISWINHTATLGICIGDTERQNQGYGTAAVSLAVQFGFEELNLNRIGLHVFSGNGRAIRAYEKAGFVREGCMRQGYFRKGRFEDVYLYSILRGEHEVRRGTAQ